MKYSAKTAPPRELIDWLSKANDDWQPTYDDLRGKPMQATRLALLVEQAFVCCYCGRSISGSHDSHIDHFRPQKTYDGSHGTDLTLSYENFVASCGPARNRNDPRTCGDAKGDWFDEDCFISPWDPNCESRFSYGSSGSIISSAENDEPAKTMIDKLQLDHAALRNERATVLLGLEAAIDSGEINGANVANEILRQRSLFNGRRLTLSHTAARYLEIEFGLG